MLATRSRWLVPLALGLALPLAAAEKPPVMPLSFIPNAGQTDPAVLYLVKGPGPDAFFTREGVTYRQAPNSRGAWSAVSVHVQGSQASSSVEPLQPLPGKVSFFLGNDPAAWRPGLPTFGGLAYRSVLPGVDVLWSGKDGRLKSDVVIAPGVDPASVRLVVSGAECMSLDSDGALHLGTVQGDIVERAPLAWQEGAATGAVNVRFKLIGQDAVGFDVQGLDPRARLVIDPVMDFATYLGGSAEDSISYVALGTGSNADHVLVGGRTRSPDFPALTGPYMAPVGSWDAFLAELRPATGTVFRCTYYGGSGDETVVGPSSESSTGAWFAYSILGSTTSPDLPMATSAFDRTYHGSGDVYWASFSDTDVVSSSYWGGSGDDEALGVNAHDYSVFFYGRTTSPDLQLMSGVNIPTGWGAPFQTHLSGPSDGFVAYGGHSGTASTGPWFVAATYLGGSGDDEVRGVESVGLPGNEIHLFITGRTWSSDFPTRPGAYNSVLNGPSDAFLTDMSAHVPTSTPWYDPPLEVVNRSTYVGGAGDDGATAFVDNEDAGKVVGIAGWTNSPDYPLVASIVPGPPRGRDAFVTLLDDTLDGITFSTLYGGSGDEGPNIRASQFLGHCTIVGTTSSPDLPLLNPVQATLHGSTDAFAATVNLASAPPRLEFASYLGGSGNEAVEATAFEGSGYGTSPCLYIGGSTNSADFPVRRAVQPAYAGGEDGFLARICEVDVLGERPPEEVLPEIQDQLNRIEARVDACDCAAMQAALASLEASAAAAATDHAHEADALDALQRGLADLLARLDALEAAQREEVEREIEMALFERNCVPWLWLPASQGGKLEIALALIQRRIDEAVASGSPGVNPDVARARLADATTAAASGDSQRACRSLCDALHAITTP